MSDALDTADAANGAEVWPYPIRYGQVKEFECDVVVLGGGIAGVWSAIGAARQGAKVILVEKTVTARSGAGGAGSIPGGSGTGVKPDEKGSGSSSPGRTKSSDRPAT